MCHKGSVTSGVQTRGSLAAVQLPFLDLEIWAGPLKTSMATQFSEELQHGPLACCAAASRRGTATHRNPFTNTDTAAPAPEPHHLDLSRERNVVRKKTYQGNWCVCNP